MRTAWVTGGSRRRAVCTVCVALVASALLVTLGVATRSTEEAVAKRKSDEVDLNKATFNDNPPQNRLPARGGPYIERNAAIATARSVGGDADAALLLSELITHREAEQRTGSMGQNLTIEPGRMVYFIRLAGTFTFTKRALGSPPITSGLLVVIVDASTGDVMLRGDGSKSN